MTYRITEPYSHILSSLKVKIFSTGQVIREKDREWYTLTPKINSLLVRYVFYSLGDSITLELLPGGKVVLNGYNWVSWQPSEFIIYLNDEIIFQGQTHTNIKEAVIYPGSSQPKIQPIQQVKQQSQAILTRKTKTRILYINSCTLIGGQEVVLKRLLRNIDKERFETDNVITHEIGPLHKEYEEYSNKLIYYDGKSSREGFILNQIGVGNYDYVHFFNLWSMYDLIPKIKQKYPNIKIIVSLLADFDQHRVSWAEDIERIRRVRPLLWAFTTDGYVNKKVFPDITVIRNGIPEDLFCPTRKTPKTIAWVGRFIETKKVNLIPQIARNLPDYKFIIVGDKLRSYAVEITESERRDITQVNLPNLEVKVELSETAVSEILAKTEYFIFTSMTESMPLTVLEALASGCCVITESVGDIANVIQDGVNGYLVPKGANTVTWIIENLPKLNSNVGESARNTVINGFTLDQMVKQYEFLYGAMGRHHDQNRIAFIWGVLPHYGIGFWDTKVDSHQLAITELSKYNVVQVFAPTNRHVERKILNGQNCTFYQDSHVPDLIQQLKEFKPDMIFLNMFGDLRWPTVVRAFPKAWKALVHYGERNTSVAWHKEVNLFIVQQEYLRSYVASSNNIPIDKVVCIPFCVEQWLFKPLPREKIYNGIMVADFRRDVKRQHLLIEAWTEIPGKLVLVGPYMRSIPPNYHEDCKALARKLGIEDRVIFIDGCPHADLPELINKAKIGFLTSSHEGGSRSLIEQMACGLPEIVLSDCEGTIHVIQDGVTGYIANPDPRSIAEKANQLLKNYRKMEKAAAEYTKQYQYHRMYERYMEVIKNSHPEVSIITTSMNRGKFIEDTIKSVINQTAKVKINHIIMDGGSTDNTLQVLSRCRDNVYNYVKKDSGQTDAILRALQIIEREFPQTRYVGWINADDYYEANWLADSISTLDSSPMDVAMVCSDAKQVTEDGQLKQYLDYTREQYITLELLGKRGNIIIQPTTLIRLSALRDIREKTGMTFNPEYHYCQDLELWKRFLYNGYRIRKLNGVKVTSNLRHHAGQMSSTHGKEQWVERDRVLHEICERVGVETPVWVRS